MTETIRNDFGANSSSMYELNLSPLHYNILGFIFLGNNILHLELRTNKLYKMFYTAVQ